MSFRRLVGLTASIMVCNAGNANVINLEVRGNNDYKGPLYIGSE